MYYRTRTYLAGDWDGDSDLIGQIMNWNKNGYLALDFTNAHDYKQARDSSLNCTIKESLTDRLNRSKTFVLIVGEKTDLVKSGSCMYCLDYRPLYESCLREHSTDLRGYVKYECDKAAKAYGKNEMKIIVIYNYMRIYKEKCPEAVRNIGTHIAGKTMDINGKERFNYQIIRDTIMKANL